MTDSPHTATPSGSVPAVDARRVAEHGGVVSATTQACATGTDPLEVARQRCEVLGENSQDTPTVPELPHLGVQHTGVGRVMGCAGFLPVELRTYGWQLYSHDSAGASADQRRALSGWQRINQSVADAMGETSTPARWALRILGPFSTMARIFLPGGQRALRDHGARQDLAHLWAASVSEQVATLKKSWGTALRVVIEEPDALAVASGAVRTASGHLTERAVDLVEIQQGWRQAGEALMAVDDTEVYYAPGLTHAHPAHEVAGILETLLQVLKFSSVSDHGLEIPLPGMRSPEEYRHLWSHLERISHADLRLQAVIPQELAGAMEAGRIAQRIVRASEHAGIDPTELLGNSVLLGGIASAGREPLPGHRALYEREIAMELTQLLV